MRSRNCPAVPVYTNWIVVDQKKLNEKVINQIVKGLNIKIKSINENRNIEYK